MIVELNILYDDFNPDGGRGRDEVIRAVDGVLGGASWESSGSGWIARR
jgi:hypothetical protein